MCFRTMYALIPLLRNSLVSTVCINYCTESFASEKGRRGRRQFSCSPFAHIRSFSYSTVNLSLSIFRLLKFYTAHKCAYNIQMNINTQTLHCIFVCIHKCNVALEALHRFFRKMIKKKKSTLNQKFVRF